MIIHLHHNQNTIISFSLLYIAVLDNSFEAKVYFYFVRIKGKYEEAS
jgi:hypothetical protein